MPAPEHGVAFVGVGATAATRQAIGSDTDMAVAACRAAAEDAGVDPADIDGVNIQVHHYPPPDTPTIVKALGMREVNWSHDGGLGIPSVAMASQVLEAGRARTIVVCKVMNTGASIATPEIDARTGGVEGPAQFDVPYGLGYTMQRVALPTRRWMSRYNITEEQVAWICLVQREHARLNPRAVFQDPLSMEDYLKSRWICEPLRLLDCDYPVNGAFAYVITRGDRARSLRHPPVYFRGWGSWGGVDAFIPHLLPEKLHGLRPEVEVLYAETGVRPSDVGLWMLYDGYSHWVLQWLEELGVAPRGQSGAYVEGGARIRWNGDTPINTNGGQLSEGRLHGAGHILEAILQLRGLAGARQVKNPDVALVSSIMPYAGAAGIFAREPA